MGGWLGGWLAVKTWEYNKLSLQLSWSWSWGWAWQNKSRGSDWNKLGSFWVTMTKMVHFTFNHAVLSLCWWLEPIYLLSTFRFQFFCFQGFGFCEAVTFFYLTNLLQKLNQCLMFVFVLCILPRFLHSNMTLVTLIDWDISFRIFAGLNFNSDTEITG